MAEQKDKWRLLNVPMTNPRCHGSLGPLIIAQGSDADILHAHSCIKALEGYNPDAVRDVVEALRDIMRETSAEDDAGENYRSDDREGALDYAYSTASKALAELEGGAS